tara:strand:+ start:507 stop:749 length:243 start_codon:yes stop_codon:yes gene_type:complete
MELTQMENSKANLTTNLTTNLRKKVPGSKEFYIKNPEKYARHKQKCLDYYNANKPAILLKRRERKRMLKEVALSRTESSA